MAEEVYESDLINMVIGTHMSIAKGIVKTAENVVKMNADTMQISAGIRGDRIIRIRR